MIARFLGWNQLSRGLITGFHVAYMLVETRYGRVDRQVFVPNVQSCGVFDMAVAVEEGGETFSWFKYKKQVRLTTVNIRNAMPMLIEANIVLFKCILNSDNRRSSPGVDSRAMSWPTWRRAPETDWATEHVVQCFRKKYFLRRKIFLAEKNIFLAEKNISCGKKYFLRKNIFLPCYQYYVPYYVLYLVFYIICNKIIPVEIVEITKLKPWWRNEKDTLCKGLAGNFLTSGQ